MNVVYCLMLEDADPWVDRAKVRGRFEQMLDAMTPPDLDRWGEDPAGELAALRLAGVDPT